MIGCWISELYVKEKIEKMKVEKITVSLSRDYDIDMDYVKTLAKENFGEGKQHDTVLKARIAKQVALNKFKEEFKEGLINPENKSCLIIDYTDS